MLQGATANQFHERAVQVSKKAQERVLLIEASLFVEDQTSLGQSEKSKTNYVKKRKQFPKYRLRSPISA
jgi:hypothetical protein